MAIRNKSSYHVAKLFDASWLCCYPCLKVVRFNNGPKFTGEEFQELLESYGIDPKTITVKNPCANTLIEQIHLTMGDMLCTKEFILNERETWLDKVQNILQSISWAYCSIESTSTGYLSGQLAFVCDMIMNFKTHVDWAMIQQKRKLSAVSTLMRGNASHLDYVYQVREKCLITKYEQE